MKISRLHIIVLARSAAIKHLKLRHREHLLQKERPIATDPNVIPYGTKVIIGGHVFTAEDTGRKFQGNQISIYVNNHAEVSASDTENTDVYLAK